MYAQDAYCYLSCPSFNSGTSSIALRLQHEEFILICLLFAVLLCDKDHPQDAIDRSTYNRASHQRGEAAHAHRADSRRRRPDVSCALESRHQGSVLHPSAAARGAIQQCNNTRSWLEDQVWALKEHIAVDARADAALWHTTNDFDGAVHALVEQVDALCHFSAASTILKLA